MTSNIAVIDVQGFKAINNSFIVKEIAVSFNQKPSACRAFSIKSPYQYSLLSYEEEQSARWLTRIHHGITWDYGEYELKDVIKYLEHHLQKTTIYVKGKEKANWVRDLFNSELRIIEILNHECDLSIKEVIRIYRENEIYCKHHEKLNHVCALRNARALRTYIEKNETKFNYK